MSQPNTLEWRIAQLEDRVRTLGERTHDLAGFATENRLNIANLKFGIEKTADKDDVDRLEREVMDLTNTVNRAAIAIAGSSLTLAVSIAVAFLVH